MPWQAWAGLAWLLLLCTGWLLFVGWLRWQHHRRLDEREPARRAALLGTFIGEDRQGEDETKAAFDEEVARLRSRVSRERRR